jgi:hypothetical protein
MELGSEFASFVEEAQSSLDQVVVPGMAIPDPPSVPSVRQVPLLCSMTRHCWNGGAVETVRAGSHSLASSGAGSRALLRTAAGSRAVDLLLLDLCNPAVRIH